MLGRGLGPKKNKAALLESIHFRHAGVVWPNSLWTNDLSFALFWREEDFKFQSTLVQNSVSEKLSFGKGSFQKGPFPRDSRELPGCGKAMRFRAK